MPTYDRMTLEEILRALNRSSGVRSGGGGSGYGRGYVAPAPSFAFNVTAANVALAKAAILKVIAGTADARILTIGDSTDAGTGSNEAAGNGLRSQSWTSQLAPLLAARLGVTVNIEGFFGGIGKSTANYALYNPKVTIGSATFAASNVGPGGPLWNHALTTGPMRFTPDSAFDRVRVFWKGNTTGRNIVWTTSTTETGSLVGDNSFAFKTTVLSVTSATWIEFKSSTAAAVEWVGLETYNSTGTKLFISNCGWGGSVSGTTADGWTQATGGGTRPLVSLPLIAPDLTFINLNINDMFNATTTAQWKTNVQALIDVVDTSGSVVLVTSNPLHITKYGSEASQAPFFTAIAELAVTNSIPFINIKTGLGGTWAAANSLGYMSDNEHMLAAGYGAKATIMDQFFATLMST